MVEDNDLLSKAAVLRFVPRFQTTPCCKPYSVAEHSFRVAILTSEIFDRLSLENKEGVPELYAIKWALIHDIQEAHTGDTPAYCKDDYEKKKHTVLWEAIVHVADVLEVWFYMLEEEYMGNQFIAGIGDNLEKRLHVAVKSADNLLKVKNKEISTILDKMIEIYDLPKFTKDRGNFKDKKSGVYSND